jgi:hypothetical protein
MPSRLARLVWGGLANPASTAPLSIAVTISGRPPNWMIATSCQGSCQAISSELLQTFFAGKAARRFREGGKK